MSDKMQRTLALIKPDAIDESPDIEKIILEEGFTVVDRRRVRLTRSEAEEFYAEHRGKSFFNGLVEYMTSGEVLALILAGDDAVTHWRRVLGPTQVSRARHEAPDSIRARFGDLNDDSHNAAHGSDSSSSAQREIRFFFPDLNQEPVLTGEGAKEYLSHAVSPTLVRALTELCKVRPEDPIVWLADWLLVNNPNKPQADN
ncbi:nucleoside diphosphate kinase homolog 5 [Procambarus clarkii]|uniref:nucleoside diphosphate kinase homolog 5 n=1 Tax=Procambarus clarkii TaxID=6728 RepID=UPI001E674C19|nr:nucleoside diphosphate kinase homolog 5-like [Procambarus clarkii]XP_045588427.1 nucleoside diphosphate kinase homolog 5-like [Procambarus clarkii]XP_045588428.1 nucleoside diphosphate kinase homolog 5-like [Procambarus clarkii]